MLDIIPRALGVASHMHSVHYSKRGTVKLVSYPDRYVTARSPYSWTVPQNEERPITLQNGYIWNVDAQ